MKPEIRSLIDRRMVELNAAIKSATGATDYHVAQIARCQREKEAALIEIAKLSQILREADGSVVNGRQLEAERQFAAQNAAPLENNAVDGRISAGGPAVYADDEPTF